MDNAKMAASAADLSKLAPKVAVTVGGKNYFLQHPGARLWVRWQSEASQRTDNKKNQINLEVILDRAFEYVVHPDRHDFRPNLDNISLEDMEEWSRLIPGFLQRGKLGPKQEGEVLPVAMGPGKGSGKGTSPE